MATDCGDKKNKNTGSNSEVSLTVEHHPLPATEDTWKHCVYAQLSIVVAVQQLFFSTF